MSIKKLIKNQASKVETKKMSFNVKIDEYTKLLELLDLFNKNNSSNKLTITALLNENIKSNIIELERELNKP